jgi:hypothetical protein
MRRYPADVVWFAFTVARFERRGGQVIPLKSGPAMAAPWWSRLGSPVVR